MNGGCRIIARTTNRSSTKSMAVRLQLGTTYHDLNILYTCLCQPLIQLMALLLLLLPWSAGHLFWKLSQPPWNRSLVYHITGRVNGGCAGGRRGHPRGSRVPAEGKKSGFVVYHTYCSVPYFPCRMCICACLSVFLCAQFKNVVFWLQVSCLAKTLLHRLPFLSSRILFVDQHDTLRF